MFIYLKKYFYFNDLQTRYRTECPQNTTEKERAIASFFTEKTRPFKAISLKKLTFAWDTREKLRILQPETEHQASVGDYKANTK